MRQALLLAVVAQLLWSVPAPSQGRGTWRDDRHGYSIRHPAGWEQIPIRAGEEWILAKFLSRREHAAVDPSTSMVSRHRPMLRVLAFPRKARVVQRETTKSGTSVTVKNPYRNYADYVKRHFQGGGYYVAVEKERDIRGTRVLHQEIKVEKLAWMPKRRIAYVYQLPDKELVAEVEVTESAYGKIKSRILKSLGSVRLFAPKVAAAQAAQPAAEPLGAVPDDAELRKEYARKKKAWRQRLLAEAAARVPKGWKKKKIKGFLVLSHASPKYTGYIVKQAQQVRKWLDRNFKNVGDGEVLRSILRVCRNSDESSAYLSGSGDSFVWDSGEVVCAEGGFLLSDFSRVSLALTQQYLSEKNPALWQAMPAWLNGGLASYASAARISKTRGFTFDRPISALTTAKKLIAEKRMISLEDLLRKPRADLAQGRVRGASDASALSVLFVRYLLAGPGKKGKTKKLVQRYMAGIVTALDELDADHWKTVFTQKVTSKEPMTEAEEEQEFKARRERAKEFEKEHLETRRRILDDLFARTFSDWSAKDWNRLDKSFRAWITRGAR